MEHFIYGFLLAALAGGLLLLWFHENRVVDQVKREKAAIESEKTAIEVEEQRLFGFLHGLGENLQVDHSAAAMHRYIVDGVTEVLEAHAGILYLLDERSQKLVPTCQTSETAPVLPEPAELAEIATEDGAEKQYRSYVRLSPITPDTATLASALNLDGRLYIEDLGTDQQFDGAPRWHQGVALAATALRHGPKNIGLLAITKRAGEHFTDNDLEVFEAAAEQCSYALGSALIFAEASEKRRLDREINQATEVQRILLPRNAPALHDYSVAADYRAARHLSGDYYDYVKVDEDRYGIAIGDVCGKGIAASLIMAMCRSHLRTRAEENLSGASVLHGVNRSIFEDIREDMFVSLLYLILERGSDEITLARAGHEPPLLFRAETGDVEMIEPPGLAAGVDEGGVFKRKVKDHRIRISRGDVLLLYTDGVIEAEDRNGEEFGIERLTTLLQTVEHGNADRIVKQIMAELESFTSGVAQIDDITLIAIEKK
ncbi:MAG: GAF domain-containing SpoIIE family protein phosphatase [Verrucomicrobiota bacterium]